ncbi:MAG: hypothetical protein K6G64_04925 [Eubacterium sp.]|nr:hypothetical protein [Eubacterium sp.]
MDKFYNNFNQTPTYMPETINEEEYEKKGLYYPGTMDNEKNEYSSKYLDLRLVFPKVAIIDHKIFSAREIEDFNKDSNLHSKDIPAKELKELFVTSYSGETKMELVVWNETNPLNEDSSKILADDLKDVIQGIGNNFKIEKVCKEIISGQQYTSINISGINKSSDSPYYVQYYVRDVKKSNVAIIIRSTNKNDMEKMLSSIKKL